MKGNESPESDQEQTFALMPGTDDKYQKINQEFENMMQRNRVSQKSAAAIAFLENQHF